MNDKDSINEHFGDALRQLREAAGIGMSELSKTTGIARSYLYLLEEGSREAPSAETLDRLADALGAEPEDLYDLAWETTGSGPGLPRMPTYFRAKYDLDDKQIKALERTLKRITEGKRH